jgi:predicted PurR-regulated permease PerM
VEKRNTIASAIKSVRQVLLVFGIIGFITVAIFGFSIILHIILLYLISIILATVLSFLVSWIRMLIPVGQIFSLIIVLIVIIGLSFLFLWFAGSHLLPQMANIASSIRLGISKFQLIIGEYPWIKNLIGHMNIQGNMFSGFTVKIEKAFSLTTTFFSEGIFVTLMSIFIVVNPRLYIDNAVRLFPPRQRKQIHSILDANWKALRSWFYGRIITMFSIALFTVIGLYIAGVPMALTLGTLAGVLDIVPFIGPLISAILTCLVTLSYDPYKTFWVIVVYLVVHILEDFITPAIQFGVAKLPPALLISVQILLFIMGGVAGILIAEPATIMAIVIVQISYIQEYLHEPVTVLGTKTKDAKYQG